MDVAGGTFLELIGRLSLGHFAHSRGFLEIAAVDHNTRLDPSPRRNHHHRHHVLPRQEAWRSPHLTMAEMAQIEASCVATTGDKYSKTFPKWRGISNRNDRTDESNLFREAQFSGDGTTIVTYSEDQHLRTFVLAPDLLEARDSPLDLAEYATFPSATPLQSYALYPGFNLQDTSTTLVLSAAKDQPIKLQNALCYDYKHGDYLFIHPTREHYLQSHVLTFNTRGTHFIAGSNNQIAIFDCSRTGAGPEVTFKTGLSQKAKKATRGTDSAFFNSCQGIVNALSISNAERLLAIGTLSREIGIYEQEGCGECITTFSTRGSAESARPGTGVTELKWSPCGRYLIIAERQCDILQVYDLRNTAGCLSTLTGREANTTQKLGIDVLPLADGHEVWGGGTDGMVRMWSNPGSQEGEQPPDAAIKMHEGRDHRSHNMAG
jgi:telomerase Cajal body protein 1